MTRSSVNWSLPARTPRNQLQYSRAGTRSEPVEQLKFHGLEIDYHPFGRRFRFTIENEDETTLSIEETGYPAGITVFKEGNREVLRWHGTPVADIRYQVMAGQLLVILEDDFYSVPVVQEMVETEAFVRPGGISVRFISRSDAGLSERECQPWIT